MKVNLKSITPLPEQTIIEIARVSSSREDKSEEIHKLIAYLIRNKHWSPFEHAFMTMEIQTSKAIGIQLLRHRSFTFQEFSQRYAKVTSIEPIELRRQAVKNRQSSEDVFDPIVPDIMGAELNGGSFKGVDGIISSDAIQEYLRFGEDLYGNLLKAGVAKECARMILPMATSTTIFMSGTIRSWIHMLQIRDDEHAQKEAQIIAQAAKKVFIEQLPETAKALEWLGNSNTNSKK